MTDTYTRSDVPICWVAIGVSDSGPWKYTLRTPKLQLQRPRREKQRLKPFPLFPEIYKRKKNKYTQIEYTAGMLGAELYLLQTCDELKIKLSFSMIWTLRAERRNIYNADHSADDLMTQSLRHLNVLAFKTFSIHSSLFFSHQS